MKLRFGLKAIFILFVAVAILLSIQVNRAKRTLIAVDTIRELGGRVYFVHQTVHLRELYTRYDTKAPLPGPNWLHKLIGEEYFVSIACVNFKANKQLSNKDWERIGSCLKNLEDLRDVRLGASSIDDSSFIFLKDLTSIEKLGLGGTYISDASMQQLSTFKDLKLLRLGDTEVTDDGLKFISQLAHLQKLYVHPNISNEGLKHLDGLKELRHLDLVRNEQITTDSAIQLVGLAKLRFLNLCNAGTHDSCQRLQQALPNTSINYAKSSVKK